MNDLAAIEKRTLTLERNFDAPRALVWEAWTQPEHIANWWAPPGMKTTVKKHDFREGGDWEYSMLMANGQEFIGSGTYSKIVVPELIETSADFKPMTEGVTMIASFIEDGERTQLVFKVIHATEAYCKQQEDMGFYNGWGSVFEVLNKYLGTL